VLRSSEEGSCGIRLKVGARSQNFSSE
jgi:hypothetical protein